MGGREHLCAHTNGLFAHINPGVKCNRFGRKEAIRSFHSVARVPDIAVRFVQ